MHFKSISQSSTLKCPYIKCDDRYEHEESLSTSMPLIFLDKLSTSHICAVEQLTIFKSKNISNCFSFLFYIILR